MNKEEYSWIRLDEVDSTNEYAKAKRGEGKNLFVLAKRQTDGRGTKGRSFSSAEGGAYLTQLVFPRAFPAKDAFRITTGAAVAVCRTLQSYGLSPKIKWANDIFVDGKKICGVLIENVLREGKIVSSVVGVGLNVNNPLPDELLEIATSMRLICGREFCVEEVVRRLADELCRGATIEEYRAWLGYVDEEVVLGEGERVLLRGVTDEGALVVEKGGERTIVRAGEVSIRV